MRGGKKKKNKVSHPVSTVDLTIARREPYLLRYIDPTTSVRKFMLYIKQRVRVHSYGHTDRQTDGHGS